MSGEDSSASGDELTLDAVVAQIRDAQNSECRNLATRNLILHIRRSKATDELKSQVLAAFLDAVTSSETDSGQRSLLKAIHSLVAVLKDKALFKQVIDFGSGLFDGGRETLVSNFWELFLFEARSEDLPRFIEQLSPIATKLFFSGVEGQRMQALRLMGAILWAGESIAVPRELMTVILHELKNVFQMENTHEIGVFFKVLIRVIDQNERDIEKELDTAVSMLVSELPKEGVLSIVKVNALNVFAHIFTVNESLCVRRLEELLPVIVYCAVTTFGMSNEFPWSVFHDIEKQSDVLKLLVEQAKKLNEAGDLPSITIAVNLLHQIVRAPVDIFVQYMDTVMNTFEKALELKERTASIVGELGKCFRIMTRTGGGMFDEHVNRLLLRLVPCCDDALLREPVIKILKHARNETLPFTELVQKLVPCDLTPGIIELLTVLFDNMAAIDESLFEKFGVPLLKNLQQRQDLGLRQKSYECIGNLIHLTPESFAPYARQVLEAIVCALPLESVETQASQIACLRGIVTMDYSDIDSLLVPLGDQVLLIMNAATFGDEQEIDMQLESYSDVEEEDEQTRKLQDLKSRTLRLLSELAIYYPDKVRQYAVLLKNAFKSQFCSCSHSIMRRACRSFFAFAIGFSNAYHSIAQIMLAVPHLDELPTVGMKLALIDSVSNAMLLMEGNDTQEAEQLLIGGFMKVLLMKDSCYRQLGDSNLLNVEFRVPVFIAFENFIHVMRERFEPYCEQFLQIFYRFTEVNGKGIRGLAINAICKIAVLFPEHVPEFNKYIQLAIQCTEEVNLTTRIASMRAVCFAMRTRKEEVRPHAEKLMALAMGLIKKQNIEVRNQARMLSVILAMGFDIDIADEDLLTIASDAPNVIRWFELSTATDFLSYALKKWPTAAQVCGPAVATRILSAHAAKIRFLSDEQKKMLVELAKKLDQTAILRIVRYNRFRYTNVQKAIQGD